MYVLLSLFTTLTDMRKKREKRGFRMDVGLRKRKARSNPYIAHISELFERVRKKREKRGFRMDVGLRKRKARSNPYIAHEVDYQMQE